MMSPARYFQGSAPLILQQKRVTEGIDGARKQIRSRYFVADLPSGCVLYRLPNIQGGRQLEKRDSVSCSDFTEVTAESK